MGIDGYKTSGDHDDHEDASCYEEGNCCFLSSSN